MKLSNLQIKKQIEDAKKLQKLGRFKEAEKIYADLMRKDGNSFDLIFSYALFSKDLKNFILAKTLLVDLTKKFPSDIKSYIVLSEILTIEAIRQVEDVNKSAEQNADIPKRFLPCLTYGLAYYLSQKRAGIPMDRIAMLKTSYEETLK